MHGTLELHLTVYRAGTRDQVFGGFIPSANFSCTLPIRILAPGVGNLSLRENLLCPGVVQG